MISDDERTAIQRSFKDGKTSADIAKELGLTRYQVASVKAWQGMKGDDDYVPGWKDRAKTEKRRGRRHGRI